MIKWTHEDIRSLNSFEPQKFLEELQRITELKLIESCKEPVVKWVKMADVKDFDPGMEHLAFRPICEVCGRLCESKGYAHT